MNNVLKSIALLFVCQVCAAETITYEIYERVESGAFTKLVAAGSRTYGLTDLVISPYESDGKYIREVFVELEQGYKIGARIFSERRLTGFGLLAQKTDRDFSWEWYDKLEGNEYVKRQGGTTVTVKVTGLPLFEELASVSFDEDAHLSFIFNQKGDESTHLIVVKSGSILRLSGTP